MCEGYLTKRATKESRFQISAWKRRYFKLWRCKDCPRLEYFGNATSKKPKGVIYIDKQTKVMHSGKYRDKSEFCLKLMAPEQKKCLYAYADTSDEVDRWISVISSAIKNHLQRLNLASPFKARALESTLSTTLDSTLSTTLDSTLSTTLDSTRTFQFCDSDKPQSPNFNVRVSPDKDAAGGQPPKQIAVVFNATHRVIKAFRATGDSELSVSAGDIVQILEPADSNGWVRVLRCHAGSYTSGHVPGGYITPLQKEERAARDTARLNSAPAKGAAKPSAPSKPPPPSYKSRMPQSSLAARSRFRNRHTNGPDKPSPILHKETVPSENATNPASRSSTFKAVGQQLDGDSVELQALTKQQLRDLLIKNDLPGYATQFFREGVNGNDLASFGDADFHDFSGLKFQLRKLKRLISITKAWGVDLVSLQSLSAQIKPVVMPDATPASAVPTIAAEIPAEATETSEAPPPAPPPPPTAPPTTLPKPSRRKSKRSSGTTVLGDIRKFTQSGLRKVQPRKSKTREMLSENSIARAMFERNQKISGTESSADDDDWSLNESDENE